MAEAEFVAPGPAFSVADVRGKKVFAIVHLIGTNHFTDTLLANLEERLVTLTDESSRREELLQNDLAKKSNELADTLRKLTTMQQEKTRQADVTTTATSEVGRKNIQPRRISWS